MLNQYFWHGEVYKSKQLRQYWVSDVLGETNDTFAVFFQFLTPCPSSLPVPYQFLSQFLTQFLTSLACVSPWIVMNLREEMA